MARAGQQVDMGGQLISFRRTAADTDGDLLEVESTWGGGTAEPVEHFHPSQEERFEVTAGRLRVRVAGAERELATGDVLVIEPRTPHAMWNEGSEIASAVWQTRPALDTESFFETVGHLVGSGKLGRKRPNVLQAAVLAREFRREFRLAKPPPALQDVLFGVLAPLARLLGFKGRHG